MKTNRLTRAMALVGLLGGQLAGLSAPLAHGASERGLPAHVGPLALVAQADTCNALSGVINDYWPGVSSPSAGSITITLGARRAGGRGMNISPKDMLLVIQMQGADINASDTADYGDGPGGLDGSGFISSTSFLAGQYEYAQAMSDLGASGGTITITGKGPGNGLLNRYVNADATSIAGARRYQVVRVPECAMAALAGDLGAASWNGSTGGIVALDTTGTLAMNGRTITATAAGFRGATAVNVPSSVSTYSNYVATNNDTGGSKGEGIAGSVGGYPNGSQARGAPANGGGGGNGHNAGGGGGGKGAAGGNGGRIHLTALDYGGRGGAAVPNSPVRVFLGGGGGAGHANNGYLGHGGNGGGVIIIRTGVISGSGYLIADGQNAPDIGYDGGGGGGAGGTIVVAAASDLSAIVISARGGKGGNNFSPFENDCHGPGGGGGGGAIMVSSPPLSLTVQPGAAGIMASPVSCGSYFAVPGTVGTPSTSLTANQIPGCELGGCVMLRLAGGGPAYGLPGQAFEATWALTNTGMITLSAGTLRAVASGGAAQTDDYAVTDLLSAESRMYTQTITPDAPLPYGREVIQHSGELQSGGSALATAAFSTPVRAPDLRATRLEVSVTQAITQHVLTYTWRVKNTGDWDAVGSSGVVTLGTGVRAWPGGEGVVTWSGDVTQGGEQVIVFTATAELGATVGVTAGEFVVRHPWRPEVTGVAQVRTAVIEVRGEGPAQRGPGDSYVVTWTVRNAGVLALEGGAVAYGVAGGAASGGEDGLATPFTPGMSATLTQTVTVDLPVRYGEETVWALAEVRGTSGVAAVGGVTTHIGAPDLRESWLVVTGTQVFLRDALRYEWHLKNSGDADALGTRAVVTLPGQAEYVFLGVESVTAGQTTWHEAGRQLEWEGDLPAGAEVVIVFHAETEFGMPAGELRSPFEVAHLALWRPVYYDRARYVQPYRVFIISVRR